MCLTPARRLERDEKTTNEVTALSQATTQTLPNRSATCPSQRTAAVASARQVSTEASDPQTPSPALVVG